MKNRRKAKSRRISFACSAVALLAIGLTFAPAAQAAPIQYAGNGHWYEFFQGPVNWATADAAATALNGYLVTITSAGEQAFLDANFLSGYWAGGSDAGSEGEWFWVRGPETGTQFWTGGLGGSAFGGAYTNWNFGEPNNQNTENFLTDNNFGANWNDCGDLDICLTNYLVEWDSNPVPEPATLLLLGTGLAAVGYRRRRKN